MQNTSFTVRPEINWRTCDPGSQRFYHAHYHPHAYSVLYLFSSITERLTEPCEQFYFFAAIPYISLFCTLVIVTYYRRHLVTSCNFHTSI